MLKTYRVAGPLPVLGHGPGERFTHDFPPDQETRLLDRGQIRHARPTTARRGPTSKARTGRNQEA